LSPIESTSKGEVFAAVEGGDLDKLRKLIGEGADINVSNDEGQTPLHVAVHARPKGEALAILLAAGANVDAASLDGTALLWATRWGKFDLMRLLVEAGAGPAREVWEGVDTDEFVTPFQDALDRGSAEMAWYLFEQFDEDPHQAMLNGKTLDEMLGNKVDRLELLRAMRAEYAIKHAIPEFGNAPEDAVRPSVLSLTPM
jgi:ankyrin repeat protein